MRLSVVVPTCSSIKLYDPCLSLYRLSGVGDFDQTERELPLVFIPSLNTSYKGRSSNKDVGQTPGRAT